MTAYWKLRQIDSNAPNEIANDIEFHMAFYDISHFSFSSEKNEELFLRSILVTTGGLSSSMNSSNDFFEFGDIHYKNKLVAPIRLEATSDSVNKQRQISGAASKRCIFNAMRFRKPNEFLQGDILYVFANSNEIAEKFFLYLHGLLYPYGGAKNPEYMGFFEKISFNTKTKRVTSGTYCISKNISKNEIALLERYSSVAKSTVYNWHVNDARQKERAASQKVEQEQYKIAVAETERNWLEQERAKSQIRTEEEARRQEIQRQAYEDKTAIDLAKKEAEAEIEAKLARLKIDTLNAQTEAERSAMQREMGMLQETLRHMGGGRSGNNGNILEWK